MVYNMSVNRHTQQKVLVLATVASVIVAVYFVRDFLPIIFFAMIMTYMFTPIFKWFRRKTKADSAAASLTFFASMLILLTPFAVIMFFTVLQVQSILRSLTEGQTLSFTQLATETTDLFNRLLSYLPGGLTISQDQVNDALNKLITQIAESFIDIVKTSIGSISAITINAVLFIYIFVNLLMYQDTLIHIVKGLNPLGDKASDNYLQKMGDTTTAMVRGQFVIAVCQGLAEAAILTAAGIDNLFFFMFLVFSLLSIIPLGAGIIVIPIGIIMVLVGDFWQGAWVLFGHFAIVTNIDNVLRPRLVPKSVRLNSALTVLSVFAGLAAFGFLGIVI